MPTSRGLRPISFWVNETEKPRAPLGDGTEIHGGVLLFVFRSLFYPAPCWQTFCWNQRLQAPPLPCAPAKRLTRRCVCLRPYGTLCSEAFMATCSGDFVCCCLYTSTQPRHSFSANSDTNVHRHGSRLYLCTVLFLDTDHISWDRLTETIRQSRCSGLKQEVNWSSHKSAAREGSWCSALELQFCFPVILLLLPLYFT